MLLTVPEVAKRVGRDPETVRRWIRSGRLRSERIGSQHFVREEDLASLVEEERLRLPPEWERTGDGTVMPPWEKLVRDGRSAH